MLVRLALILGIAIATPAVAQTTVACEPSALCALRSARDAAFARYPRATTERERRGLMATLYWAAERDDTQDPAALLPRYAAVRARIDALPDTAERQRTQVYLARVMGEAGLTSEAAAFAARLTRAERDFVQTGIARGHARRGRVREAMQALDAIPAGSISRKLAASGVFDALAALGRPELVREMAPLMKDPPADPALVSSLVSLAEVVAGRHDAARAEAVRIEGPDSRFAALNVLYNRYKERGNDAEALATARAFMPECQAVKLEPALRERLLAKCNELFADALENAGQHAELLAWLPKLDDDTRARKLRWLVSGLSSSAGIRQAEKLIRALPETNREELAAELVISRVRVGELTVANALKQVPAGTGSSGFLASVAGRGDRARMAESLARLAREQGTNNREQGLATIRAVATAADEIEDDLVWVSIVGAQIDLGALDDARKAIDERLSENWKGGKLLCLSAAQAKAGKAEESKRTFAAGMQVERAQAVKGGSADGTALNLANCGLFDASTAELRRLVAAGTEPRKMDSTHSIMPAFAQNDRLAQAFDVARLMSRHRGDDPEPFEYLYAHLARDLQPRDQGLPRIDPMAPIRADAVPEDPGLETPRRSPAR